MSYDFDLFIIGAGPAGLAAAKQAADYGVNVAIAEQHALGGCCINRGCIPKKLMVYASDIAEAMRTAADYQWEPCFSQFHWQQFREKRNQELQRLHQVQQQALDQHGVQLLKGHTQFVDAHTLSVEGQKHSAHQILIAVGGKPFKPKIAGIEHAITSDDLINIEQLPKRMAIIGGGYIGVEFASILNGFGCDITLMDHEACILDGFDDDVRSRVREGLLHRGIQSLCGTTTDKITQTSDGLCLHLTGNHAGSIVVDQVLCATGRAPDLEELGLEATGVEFDQKAIAVDHNHRTTQPHIYAVGDCTNHKQLTPVARNEGRAAVDAMFSQTDAELNYSLVPSAVLSRPEASSVGLTEAQARERYGDAIECYRTEFVPLRQRLTDNQQPALMKLVVDKNSDRILGIHMVGEHAAEIVQSAALSLHANMTRQALMQTIGIHPTSAEELFSL